MFNQGNNNFFTFSLLIFAICIFMLLNGCALKKAGYSPDYLESQLQDGNLRQKTDRLLVVVDGRGTFNFKRAYYILQGIEETIPPGIDYEKIFRIYGWDVESFSEDISTLFGLPEVQYQGIEELVVTRVLPDSNITPLSLSLDSIAMELVEAEGHNALVVISNGRQISDDALRSAGYLKEALGGRICFYPVLMGDDPRGKERLKTLTEIGECGYLNRSDDLLAAAEMIDFVRNMFFSPAEDIPSLETAFEKKPGLEEMLGRDKKIHFVLNVEFEFDKAVILPGFDDELKRVADFLRSYPRTVAELVGHTDSTGSDGYNRRLSLERARSVRRHLIDNFGIDGERLTVKGAGETEPVADNSSAAGRQRNRRVVAVVSRQVKEFSSR